MLDEHNVEYYDVIKENFRNEVRLHVMLNKRQLQF